MGKNDNLSPGCSVDDLPGNSPEDDKWDSIIDNFFNKERLVKSHIGTLITEKQYEIMDKLYADDIFSDTVDAYIMAAIEYGMELAKKEAIEDEEQRGYYNQLL